MHVQQMMSTHPGVRGAGDERLAEAIEQALSCAQICRSCADACLAEDMVAELRQCIRLNLDCADICDAAARLAGRRTGANEALAAETLRLCARAASLCAAECERHARRHEHCRICAEACRACEAACGEAQAAVTAH